MNTTGSRISAARSSPRTELPSAQTMIFSPAGSGLERLVTLSTDRPHRIWPFVARVPDRARPSDPVNVVIQGLDARGVRAVLLSLDAERPAGALIPGIDPAARWQDAMGAVQIAYGEGHGWTGGVVQLELGTYEGVRVHLRLFDLGNLTVGNAHLDFLVPGTAEHAVLAWDAAAEVVRAELVRSGVLVEAPAVSERITPSPYRDIPGAVLGVLPDGLRDWLALPAEAERHPIRSSGRALIFQATQAEPGAPGIWTREIELPVETTLVKPFCRSAEDEWVHLKGTLRLSHRVIQGAGRFSTSFTAQGLLRVTPLDAQQRNPSGIPYAARVSERYLGFIDDGGPRASVVREHSEFLSDGGPGETRAATERVLVEPGREPDHWVRQRC